MSKTEKLFKVSLQLFAEGGAAVGGAEGSEVAGAESTPKAETKPSGSGRRSKSGEFDNVVFGKQDTASLATEGTPVGAGLKADVTTTSDTLEERRKAYNEFINGEYKDLDQERFQQVFDRRFKQVKGIEAELASQKPIIDMLMSKYGVDDVSKLESALKEDTEYWESVAEENGMTVEQYFNVEKLKRENAELQAIRQREQGQKQAQNQINAWYQEAERVKEIYPSFDFRRECENPEFISMLKHGNTVEHAYKIMHFDELTQDAARIAAQNADERAQARIKQKASRPSENGTSSQSAAIVKSNVHDLTRKERAEIARRAQRGEQIRF